MPQPFLDASARHPLTRLDGKPHLPLVQLARVIDHPNIDVGDHTYYNDFDPVEDYAARLAPYLYAGAPQRLVIGRFCQIAHGVRFLAGGNHMMDGFSTYPFSMFDHALMAHYPGFFAPRPDTVIGHDVWLGQGAMVLPGATIGNGAIVGAGAVVGGEVPAWTLVAGNPARVLRKRFDEATCALLERLAWWDLPAPEIRALVPVLASGDRAGLEKAVARLRG